MMYFIIETGKTAQRYNIVNLSLSRRVGKEVGGRKIFDFIAPKSLRGPVVCGS